jgi:catechol 2,3-dioxygenase-like lactoylglutathione lyase family enzyme
MKVVRIDHVQLAMPPGREREARAFYGQVLGLREVEKPPELAPRGGVWFEGGSARLHLGSDPEFHPATKAHPALLVVGLAELLERCRASGIAFETDDRLPGFKRAYVRDPFGNRLEFLQHSGD